MPTRTPLAEEYDVGWITAIPTEYYVACELLDERFNPPSFSQHDTNIYTFGAIGSHKVVIACSPLGKFGASYATSVAVNMQHSFRGLRYTLSVGIGGGAPTRERDIRLGDVVVSVPTGYYNGVLAYECGKLVQGRSFERTASLDAPASTLLTATQRLSALHGRKGHQIQQTVNSMIRRNPRLGQEYQFPGRKNDMLFASGFLHQGHGHCKKHCAKSKNAVVQRPARSRDEDTTVVHYGLIASADRLMKDAKIRDEIVRTDGALCFETQAAGLMNYTHCLVIRGVCNYADSHESQMWQGYAAATAAAYAKELLAVVPAFRAEDVVYPQRPMMNLQSGYNNMNHFTGANVPTLTNRMNTTVPIHPVAPAGLANVPVQAWQPVQRDPGRKDQSANYPGVGTSGKLHKKAPSGKLSKWLM